MKLANITTQKAHVRRTSQYYVLQIKCYKKTSSSSSLYLVKDVQLHNNY